jgi:hypothetical protein
MWFRNRCGRIAEIDANASVPPQADVLTIALEFGANLASHRPIESTARGR